MNSNEFGSKWLKDHDAATQRAMVEAFRNSTKGRAVLARFPGKATTADSVEGALIEAGANFTVGKFPMMAVLDADTAVHAKNVVGICRTDSGEVLGTATPSYSCVQLADVFAPAEVLAQRGQMSLEKIQVVDGGSRVRLSGLVGMTAIPRPLGALDAPDVLAHFATFTADFSGKARNTAALMTMRLICLNGATTLDRAGVVSIKHVGQATEKTRQAYAALLNITEAAQAEAAMFQGFAQRPMNAVEFVAFAADVLNTVRGEIEDGAKQARREAEIAELAQLFVGGAGNTGSSLWDGYNAVTEWVDHQKARAGKVRDAAKHFESANYGTGERVKRAARAMLARW